MLKREDIRPDKCYVVKKRRGDQPLTLARTTGELPALSLRVLDETYTPICSEYDFIVEIDLEKITSFYLDKTEKETVAAEDGVTKVV